jgi:hypothetical protein
MKEASCCTPTPVREALEDDSYLVNHVHDGVGAVKDKDKKLIDPSIRTQFADSLDTDEAFRVGRDQEPRWDYLLGHENRSLIAVEPHSAKTDEIQAVINKKRALRQQLNGHLKDGMHISKWLWVASGTVCFPRGSRHEIKLSQSGIEFVGRCVQAKHLS